LIGRAGEAGRPAFERFDCRQEFSVLRLEGSTVLDGYPSNGVCLEFRPLDDLFCKPACVVYARGRLIETGLWAATTGRRPSG
jgi:hypothetical protein